MMNNEYALPPEWAFQEAVLISWPHCNTDWKYILPWVTECYAELCSKIVQLSKLIIVCPDPEVPKAVLKDKTDPSRIIFLQMETNDTWARDFGMICTTCSDKETVRINDFKFNGWGLKFAACFDNLININILKDIPIHSRAEYVNRLGFVLEGGSIEIDGHGTIMTTSECLLSPNRNGDLSKEQIDSRLKEWLGAEKILWIENGALAGDDTDSHIDTLARFLTPNIIAYSSCDRENDEHFHILQKMEAELKQARDAQGNPYILVPLPIPEAIYDEDGLRLPATYANFLILNGTVLLPVYGDEKYDQIAISNLQQAAPEYNIVTVDCRSLIWQHGSLHCATMQIPRNALTL